MDHLDLVSLADPGLGPFPAAHHIMVQFDRDALARQRKKFQQALQMNSFGNFSFLAVYHN
jgi:hypothetical protein